MIIPEMWKLGGGIAGVVLLLGMVAGAGYACYSWGYSEAEQKAEQIRIKELLVWQTKLNNAKTALEVKGVEYTLVFNKTVTITDTFKGQLDEAEKVEPEFAAIIRPPAYSGVRLASRKAVGERIACAYGNLRDCL